MSSFTTPLIVSPLPDGRTWRLVEEFDYHVGSEDSLDDIHVPVGFLTDFASIPHWLWFLPWWATFNKAAVVHDWLYHAKKIMAEGISRGRADRVFLEAMLVDWRHHDSRYLMAYVEYIAVRLFGWLAWRRKSHHGATPAGGSTGRP